MTTLYVVLGIAVILTVVLLIIISQLPKREEYLPYEKKKYLMTLSERKLFAILQETFAEQYYVFPQIHIASIIKVKNYERQWQMYFNKIIRKSVDFVIFDKENISPLLAIELDDSSHDRPDRIIRDGFVDSAFKSAQIKIHHIKTHELDDVEGVKNGILGTGFQQSPSPFNNGSTP